MKVHLLDLKEKDIQSYALTRASLLQKLLRRGLTSQALWVGELFIKDGHEKGLRRKLYQIFSEDVGLGNPYLLSTLLTSDWKMGIALICASSKNREVDRFCILTKYALKHFTQSTLSTQEEVRTLRNLLKVAHDWNDNKRKKEKLVAFEAAGKELSLRCRYPEKIMDCIITYIDLAKAKVHASDDLLALAVLLSLRNPDPVNVTISSIPETEMCDPVPSFALDKHTPFGKQLNRSWDHWEKEGCVVIPEVFYDSLFDEKKEERYPMSLFMKVLKSFK